MQWGEVLTSFYGRFFVEEGQFFKYTPSTSSLHLGSHFFHLSTPPRFGALILPEVNQFTNPDQGHTYPPKRSSTIFTNMNVSKFIFVGFASRILAKGTNFKTRLMTDVVMWSQELSWIVNIKLLYYCIFLDIICINKTVNRKQLCNIHCEKNPNIKYTLQVLHVL